FDFLVDNIGSEINLEDARLCPEDRAVLDAGEGFASYEWSNGETTQFIEVGEAGMYSVVAIDTSGCQAQGEAEIIVEESPEPEITGELLFIGGGGTTTISTGFFEEYAWSNGIKESSILVGQEGDYAVTVTNAAGCTATQAVFVEEFLVQGYLIPNAFSPNRDGVNDTWGVYGPNVIALNMRIYNRWGKEIFTAQDISETWDGTFKYEDQPIGTYVYIGELTLLNGTVEIFQGNITLIR
ncbi:MAG: gliding motility-associated C-terminal domain-containing protein, partial [Chitinophagales bacterium]